MFRNFSNLNFPGCTVNILIITPDSRRLLKEPGVMMNRDSFVKSVCHTNVTNGYDYYDLGPPLLASPHQPSWEFLSSISGWNCAVECLIYSSEHTIGECYPINVLGKILLDFQKDYSNVTAAQKNPSEEFWSCEDHHVIAPCMLSIILAADRQP